VLSTGEFKIHYCDQVELDSEPCLPSAVPKWGLLFSELRGNTPEFLQPEWHGHVCLYKVNALPKDNHRWTWPSVGLERHALFPKIVTPNPCR
jgi:hypothetical protein